MKLETGTTELVVRQMRWESQASCPCGWSACGAAVPTWTPGAHLDIHLGRACPPVLAVRGSGRQDRLPHRGAARPAGRGGSRHVHDVLRPGQRVPISAPRNNFELLVAEVPVPGGRHRYHPDPPDDWRGRARGAHWDLYYGGRTRASMAFLDELEHYGDRVHIVSEDREGRLDLAGLLAAPPDTLVYTCGPEGLLAAVESYSRCGRSVRSSSSASSPRRAPRPRSGRRPARPRRLQPLRHQHHAGPDESLLDALEAASTSSTRAARALRQLRDPRAAGLPDHRDSLLSSAEQESGKTIMICVSRAKTDELVLDL